MALVGRKKAWALGVLLGLDEDKEYERARIVRSFMTRDISRSYSERLVNELVKSGLLLRTERGYVVDRRAVLKFIAERVFGELASTPKRRARQARARGEVDSAKEVVRGTLEGLAEKLT